MRKSCIAIRGAPAFAVSVIGWIIALLPAIVGRRRTLGISVKILLSLALPLIVCIVTVVSVQKTYLRIFLHKITFLIYHKNVNSL